MNFGFIVPFASVAQNLELAVEIEAAGWDGYFTWDAVAVGDGQIDIWDPWALLAAVAVKTGRITLGAMVFPLSRRRPWIVARQAVTVDHLSNGRLVIPVGLGAIDDPGFQKVHPEIVDRKARASRLDETLAILDQAWSGAPVQHEGTHYRIDAVPFAPRPVQRPRIPIWVVAAPGRPKSMARAAKWDGVIPAFSPPPGRLPEPGAVAEAAAWMREHRPDGRPFELVLEGISPGNDPDWAAATLKPLAEAGATWWIESRWDAPNDVGTLLARIRQGPPRL